MKKNSQTNNGRWAKGTSGNPSGRPPGSRNKATLIIEQLLEDESEQLARKLINLAKEGDISALRLCMDRLAPVPKERNIHLDLLPGHTAEELAANSQRVLSRDWPGLDYSWRRAGALPNLARSIPCFGIGRTGPENQGSRVGPIGSSELPTGPGKVQRGFCQ